MKLIVYNLEGKKVGEVSVAEGLLDAPFRGDLLARVVNWQRAGQRAGTHKVKARSEVHGSTRKIIRQKGTGSSRRSTRKAPHFRGGGVAFGPTPRNHAHDIPRKVRRFALRSALSEKQREGKLFVIGEDSLPTHKTAQLAAKQKVWPALAKAMIVLGEFPDSNFVRAARNIPNILLVSQQGLNVYDMIRYETLLLSQNSLSGIEKRLLS